MDFARCMVWTSTFVYPELHNIAVHNTATISSCLIGGHAIRILGLFEMLMTGNWS